MELKLNQILNFFTAFLIIGNTLIAVEKKDFFYDEQNRETVCKQVDDVLYFTIEDKYTVIYKYDPQQGKDILTGFLLLKNNQELKKQKPTVGKFFPRNVIKQSRLHGRK